MNKLFFILLFTFGFLSAKAQDVILDLKGTTPVKIDPKFSLYAPQHNYEYLVEQWSKGKLFYNNGSSKLYDSLNFNRHLNMIEVVLNNKVLTLMPTGLKGALIYHSNKALTLLIVSNFLETATFVTVLDEGKFLLASYLTTTKPEAERGFKTDEIRFVPEKLEDAIITEHYIVLKENNWHEIKWSKSNIGKLFKIDKKALQQKASEAGIELKSDQGLFQIFKVLNKK